MLAQHVSQHTIHLVQPLLVALQQLAQSQHVGGNLRTGGAYSTSDLQPSTSATSSQAQPICVAAMDMSRT